MKRRDFLKTAAGAALAAALPLPEPEPEPEPAPEPPTAREHNAQTMRDLQSGKYDMALLIMDPKRGALFYGYRSERWMGLQL